MSQTDFRTYNYEMATLQKQGHNRIWLLFCSYFELYYHFKDKTMYEQMKKSLMSNFIDIRIRTYNSTYIY